MRSSTTFWPTCGENHKRKSMTKTCSTTDESSTCAVNFRKWRKSQRYRAVIDSRAAFRIGFQWRWKSKLFNSKWKTCIVPCSTNERNAIVIVAKKHTPLIVDKIFKFLIASLSFSFVMRSSMPSNLIESIVGKHRSETKSVAKRGRKSVCLFRKISLPLSFENA